MCDTHIGWEGNSNGNATHMIGGSRWKGDPDREGDPVENVIKIYRKVTQM